MSLLLGLDLLLFSKCNRASSLARAARSHPKLLLLDFIEEIQVWLVEVTSIDLLAPIISHDIFEHLFGFDDFD